MTTPGQALPNDDPDDSAEIVGEFLVESYENLDQLDRDLVELERDPGALRLLQSIFRTIHTIKGTSGFLGFVQLEAITHAGEGLLSRLRDGGLALTEERANALLELVDAVRELLAIIERVGAEELVDHDALIISLTALREDPEPTPGDGDATTPDHPQVVESVPPGVAPNARDADLADPQPRAGVSPEPTTRQVPEPRVEAEAPEAVGLDQPLTPAATQQASEGADDPPRPSARAGESRSTNLSESTIRVDVTVLDALMRQVGELVLVRNQIVAAAATSQTGPNVQAAQRLSQLVSELQATVMKTRMQSIDTVWSKLPRVVRDLSVQCGRQVQLELEGRDTELDKTVLEAIKDPLTHIVRNAIDHGIESPDDRVARGKPVQGRLVLRAFHEGGQVNLEISDDGAGIDAGKIAAKAVERGLITVDQVKRMTTGELTNLIFAPGLSTARAVTNVSGRGVGMDVVRTNIEKIGGAVDVISEVGTGTTMRIKIPLTLAIIPALTVQCVGERYAVPQVSIDELVTVDGNAGRVRVERVSGTPVLRLRGELVPLVDLGEVLDVATSGDGDDRPICVVVLRADGHRFGLVVDQILSTEEVVVKPLSSRLKGSGPYAGATILGDGRVALIIDVRAMARRAQVLQDGDVADSASHQLQVSDHGEEPLLIVDVGTRRIGLPLAMVTRLEEISAATVERSGMQGVVQYRGDLMRLTDLCSTFGVRPSADRSQQLTVIVSARGRRHVGMVVDAVVDIATEAPDSRSPADGTGLVGVAVVQGKVTELLDVTAIINAVDPQFFETAVTTPATDLSAEVGA